MPETAGDTNVASEWRAGIVFANSTIVSRDYCLRNFKMITVANNAFIQPIKNPSENA